MWTPLGSRIIMKKMHPKALQQGIAMAQPMGQPMAAPMAAPVYKPADQA